MAREPRGAAHIRVVVDGLSAGAIPKLTVGCWRENGTAVWTAPLTPSFRREVPASELLRVGLRDFAGALKEDKIVTAVANSETTIVFDLASFGVTRFDLRQIPRALQFHGVSTYCIEPPSGRSMTWPVVPDDQSMIALLAHPPGAAVQLRWESVRLTDASTGGDTFALGHGVTYTVQLPPDAVLVCAAYGSRRLSQFAVLTSEGPLLVTNGVAMVSATKVRGQVVTVVGEQGWAQIAGDELLPLIENVVQVGNKWATVEVYLEGDPRDVASVQLSGPSPDGKPLLPSLMDPRVRESSLKDGRCVFYPVVPGEHHVRLLSRDNKPSPVVSAFHVDTSPSQSIRLSIHGFARRQLRIAGFSELLNFLGTRFVNDGSGGGIGANGKLVIWDTGGDLEVLPSFEVALPRGIPVSTVRTSSGDIEGELRSNIAFVVASANPQHGGRISFERPGLVGKLAEQRDGFRFVTVQGDVVPYLVWERTETQRLLVGWVAAVPHQRYCEYRVDTAGRWVTLEFSAPLQCVEVCIQVGAAREILGAYTTMQPARVWLPRSIRELRFRAGDRSWSVLVPPQSDAVSVKL